MQPVTVELTVELFLYTLRGYRTNMRSAGVDNYCFGQRQFYLWRLWRVMERRKLLVSSHVDHVSMNRV